MNNEEFSVYFGMGKILQNIAVNVDFNEMHSKKHNWSDVPFPSAKSIMIDTGKHKYKKVLPISGYDVPQLWTPDKFRQMHKDDTNFPTSANWFQIFHTLNDLAKMARQRYVLGLQVIDNGETLEFIMEND
jgi:hypothetical protein